MARFKADEVDKYGGQGGAGYFKLQDDGDVARVRFLYGGIDDVEGDAVHVVKIDDKKRYVNCLRAYNEPKDACPFCREGKYQVVKLFIPVYNIDEDKVQIWERGKKMFNKMSSLCSRYKNIVSHVFEIERNGAKGSKDTIYEIYEVDKDDAKLSDFEQPEIMGSAILDKSVDDMEFYLENGYFPPEDGEEKPQIRRRSDRRRTPATSEDSF